MKASEAVTLLLLVRVCISRINFLTNYSIVNSTGGLANALDYDSAVDFIITSIQLTPTGSQMLILIPNISTSPPTFTTKYATALNAFTYRFRTKQSYTRSILNSSPNFTQFNRTCQITFKNYTTIPTVTFSSMPFNTFTRDFIYIENNTVLNTFEVVDNYTNSKTQVGISGFDRSIFYTVDLQWDTIDKFVKGLQKNGMYFMIFADGLCVVRIDATLGEVFRVQWQLSLTQDIGIFGGFLVCSYDFNVSIYNISANFTRIFTMTLKQSIFSCKMFTNQSLLVLTSTGIYQYNIYTGVLQTTFPAAFQSSTAMDIMWGRYLVLYEKNPQLYSKLGFYYLDDQVDPVVPALTPSPSPVVVQVVVQEKLPEPSEFDFLKNNEKYSRQISEAAGTAMRISTVQAVSKSVTMLIMILDDLEYYQYHKVNYTYPIQFMILNINALNSVRYDAWFLKDSGVDEKAAEKWASQEALYSSQFTQDDRNPSFFYFLNAARPAYLDNLLMCILFFLGMKVLYCLFYLVRRKHITCAAISKWFRLNTTWWMLPAAFLENNMAALTFCCFVQLQGMMVSCFNFGNKANMCMAVLTLFCLLFYSFCFYLIIYAFSRKRVAKTLLSESKCMASGFFWKSFSRTTRNLIRSFFHGFFVFNYKMQIVGLAWSNVLYILATIAFRKSFSSVVVFLFFVLYYLAFFAFDLSLALNYLSPNFFRTINFEMFTFAIMTTLFFIILALAVFSLLKFVLQIAIKYLKKTFKKYKTSKLDPSTKIEKKAVKIKSIFIPVTKNTSPNTRSRAEESERTVKNKKNEKSEAKSHKKDSQVNKSKQLTIKKSRFAMNSIDNQPQKQTIIPKTHPPKQNPAPKSKPKQKSKTKATTTPTPKIHPTPTTHRHQSQQYQPEQPRNRYRVKYKLTRDYGGIEGNF